MSLSQIENVVYQKIKNSQTSYILFEKKRLIEYNEYMNQEELSEQNLDHEENKQQLGGMKSFKFIIKLIFIIIFSPVILLYLIIRLIVKKVKRARWQKNSKRGKMLLMSSDISDIDIMEGYAFEEYLKTLFFYAGFKAETTPRSKDYGADLILTEEDGNKIVVQAKRYNKTVGIKSVQEIMGAISHYKANEGFVVTSSHFSPEAETLAKENGIRLIDREELIEMYKRVQDKLNINAKESSLISGGSSDLEQRYPHMI